MYEESKMYSWQVLLCSYSIHAVCIENKKKTVIYFSLVFISAFIVLYIGDLTIYQR